MRRRGLGLGLAAAVASLLVLCAAAPASDVTIRGPKIFTTVVLDYDANEPGYCGTRTGGQHHSFVPGPGGVLVGYDNFYDSGTDPLPCWEKIDHAYRGYVRFKTEWLAKYKRGDRVGFTNAYLVFNIVRGERVEGTTAFERAFWSAARSLGVLTSKWPSSGEDGRHLQRGAFTPATFSRNLPTGTKPGGARVGRQSFKVGVTPLVTDWICGKRANNGFVLKGLNESYAENSDLYLSEYANFRLVLKNIGARKGVRRC
jgi:hypothetical protein